jgi:hypothetical protein
MAGTSPAKTILIFPTKHVTGGEDSMRSLSVLLAVGAIANLACIEPAPAQEWPSRPLAMVVSFAGPRANRGGC